MGLGKIFKDCFTGIDGSTYEPVRTMGFGGWGLSLLTYHAATVWHLWHGNNWDPQAYATSVGLLLTAGLPLAAAERTKSTSEPPLSQPATGTQSPPATP